MVNSAPENDNKNIAKRSFTAAGWVLIVQFTMQFIQIILGICMLRILTPEDYGLLGMLSIFWAVSLVFIGGGFSQALIQRQNITELDLCSVFYYNIFLSFLCCGLMIGFSHKIAVFYEQPVLEGAIKVLAWTLPIGALASVQNVLLARHLKQFFITISTLISHLTAGLVAIFLAWLGMGVWALVWQRFIAALLSTIAVFLFVRWIPKLKFSFKALASLFTYGSKLLVIAFLDAVVTNFTNMVIGKCEKVETLGFYTRAKTYSHLWPFSVQGAISSVLFPAFSKIQDDTARLRSALRRSISLSAFAVAFLPFLLCVLCKPIILLLFGEKWLPCLPYWWLITCAVVFFPIQSLNVQLLKARGRSDLYLLLDIARKFLYIVQIVVLIVYGLIPMLVCEIIFSLICVYLNTYFTGRALQYGFTDQLRDFLPYVLITIPSCLFAWELYQILTPYSPWGGLIVPGILGPVVYLALNRLFKTQALVEFVNLTGRRFPFIKKLLFYRNGIA